VDRIPAGWVAEGPGRRIQANLQRVVLHPGGAWSLSWVFVFLSGFVLDPMRGPLEASAAFFFAALFPALTWVGALAFAGRPAPLWILPAAGGLGLLRGAVFGLAGPAAGNAFSLIYEPAAVLAAIAVVWRAELLDDEAGLRVGLVFALFGVAILEVAGGLTPGFTVIPEPLSGWMIVGPVAMLFQLSAMWAWIARRELRIERAEDGQRELVDAVAQERRESDLLRRKEAWLFDFFEKAPDMLIVLAPRSCEILRCNRRFSETLGRPRRELIGRSLFDFVDPETVENVRPVLAAGRRRLRNQLIHLRRQDGSELVVLANLALRDGPEGASEVRGILHDVTRIEHMDVASRRDVHRILTEHAAVGIFHTDDRGRCAAVNASFCELTGVTPGRAREESWLRYVHGDDRRRVEDAWDCSVEEGSVFRMEHRLQPEVGPSLRVLTECHPIEDETVGGFAGSMTRVGGASPAASLEQARRDRDAAGRD